MAGLGATYSGRSVSGRVPFLITIRAPSWIPLTSRSLSAVISAAVDPYLAAIDSIESPLLTV